MSRSAVARGFTVKELAAKLHLPVTALTDHGVHDGRYGRAPAVVVPYRDENGRRLRNRYAVSAYSRETRSRKGGKEAPYGLWRVPEIRETGYVLLLGSERECWVAWHHGLPALGHPPDGSWRPEWSALLAGLEVIYWPSRVSAETVSRIAPDMPGLRVVVSPSDLCQSHAAGEDLRALVAEARHQAADAALYLQAAPLTWAPDPIEVVREAIRRGGYGGDLSVPLLVYLAATTRLLGMSAATIPCHLLLKGSSSAGKSFAVRAVLGLMSPETYLKIDAGSPAVLVYGSDDLRHRLLVLSEADSLPAGEDNPAASAVRNLLQDHHLRYEVVTHVKGEPVPTVKRIERPGPTVLVTTSVKPLGTQLTTRMFVVAAPDDKRQIGAALMAAAETEVEGRPGADPAHRGYQALLQRAAPWRVAVPFAVALAECMRRGPASARVLRDFQRILSLVKAVTILRHAGRERDLRGRLVATLEDYDTVRELVNDTYSGSGTGVTDAVRRVVRAVKGGAQSYSDAARKMGVAPMQARRYAQEAIKGGWLQNEENGRGRSAKLSLGDPLRRYRGLPPPRALTP